MDKYFTDKEIIPAEQELLKKKIELLESYAKNPVETLQGLQPHFRPPWFEFQHPSPQVVEEVIMQFAALYGVTTITTAKEIVAERCGVSSRQVTNWTKQTDGRKAVKASPIGIDTWRYIAVSTGNSPAIW